MPERSVTVRVNGRDRPAIVEPRLTLADFLRSHCRLTGTHLGCEQVVWNGGSGERVRGAAGAVSQGTAGQGPGCLGVLLAPGRGGCAPDASGPQLERAGYLRQAVETDLGTRPAQPLRGGLDGGRG